MSRMLAVLLASNIFGSIIGYAPLLRLDRQADVIVVGQVISVRSTRASSTIRVQVIRTVRGSSPVGCSLSLHIDGPVLDGEKAITYGPRLWFLRSGTVLARIANIDGIDGYSLPAASAATHMRVAEDSALKPLVLELVAAVRDGKVDSSTRNQINHYIKSLPAIEQEEAERQLALKPGNTPPVH